MDIKKLAEEYNDYIIERRRFYHSIPELSYEEVETTENLVSDLEKMGIEVTTFSDYNGLIGTIRGNKPGKTVMLRADIDALPIEEKTGLPFASTHPGKMHACGHDAHMSMLLGAAKILVENKDMINGEIKLLFQAAEESAQGARYYVEQGYLDGIDAVFGMHVWGTFDAPLISFDSGDRMASCDNFKINVKGVSTHGSSPHLGKDAIVAASSIVTNLQSYVSRINDPVNPLVITVGKFNGGSRFNILASNVDMEGTIRTYSRELRKSIEDDLREIIDNTARTYGCEATLEFTYLPGPIINEHEDINNIAQKAAVKLYGEDMLTSMPKLMGSEDFAFLMEKAPGFFGFLGCLNKEKGIVYSNHNEKFTVDEDILHRGTALYAQFAVDFLNK